jgi:hypothetical protein
LDNAFHHRAQSGRRDLNRRTTESPSIPRPLTASGTQRLATPLRTHPTPARHHSGAPASTSSVTSSRRGPCPSIRRWGMRRSLGGRDTRLDLSPPFIFLRPSRASLCSFDASGNTTGTTWGHSPVARQPRNAESPLPERAFVESGRLDLNQRPFGPQPNGFRCLYVPERPPRPMCPAPWTIWTDRTVHPVPKRYYAQLHTGARFASRQGPTADPRNRAASGLNRTAASPPRARNSEGRGSLRGAFTLYARSGNNTSKRLGLSGSPGEAEHCVQ